MMTKSLLLDKTPQTNWQKIKIGDIADVISGGTPSTKNYDFWNGDISWLTPKDLSGYKERYISKGERNITTSGLQNSSARLLPKGTVLLTSRAPIGYLAIAKQEVCTNQGFKSIILKGGYLPEFFYYLLKNNIEYIIGMSSGSTFAEISGTQVKNLEFNVPDYDTQKKIAGVLGALDDKIELNNKINQNLEAQAQALFKSWFVDFEPFGSKMPSDWKIGKLGNFIEIKRGGSPRPIQNYISTSGLKWLKISDATSEMSPYILTIKECIEPEGLSKTVKLDAGSLVLSNSATPGIPKILDIESCIHDGWLYFPKSNFSNEYLYLLFKYIRNDLISLGNGSIFTNLKTDILKSFEIVIPSISALNDFNKIIVSAFALIHKNRREIKNLIELRDTLLPKLMSGEVNVDDVK